MKKLRNMFLCTRTLAVLFAICGAVALQSCSKDEDPAPAPATLPTISINSITTGTGAHYVDGNQIVNADVSIYLKAGGTVAKVEVFVDDQLIGKVDEKSLANFPSKPYQFTWDSKTVKDGNHIIKAVVTDSYNQTEKDQAAVVVKNNP